VRGPSPRGVARGLTMADTINGKGNEMSSERTSIHGESAVSLAAILEYIQLPNHPFYEQAKIQATAFVEAQRQARIEEGQKAMQEQMKYIDEASWSAIVN